MLWLQISLQNSLSRLTCLRKRYLICLVSFFWMGFLIFNLKTRQNNNKHNIVLLLISLTPLTIQLFSKTRVVGTIASWQGLYSPSNQQNRWHYIKMWTEMRLTTTVTKRPFCLDGLGIVFWGMKMNINHSLCSCSGTPCSAQNQSTLT